MEFFDNKQQTEQIEELKQKLSEADAVIIGAGAGLSTSAGFAYGGERFHKYFPDFIKRYNFSDEYSGGFMVGNYPAEEFWAFWSRNIYINRYMKAPKPVYEELLAVVKDQDYFVLTTNVDHRFQMAGFDKQRLFYTQGDYGLWQCSEPCHQKTYDNEEIVKKMVLAQGFVIAEDGELIPPSEDDLKMTVPAELIPRCPVCGKPMTTNLRADDTFVQDEGWYAAQNRFASFLSHHGVSGSFGFANVPELTRGEPQQKIVYLELGIGMNTPGIVKYPFWQQVYKNPNATYVCLNYGQAYAPEEIKGRSMCLDGDIGTILEKLNLK